MIKERFIPGRSPANGDILLIVGDYAWWVQNQKEIEKSLRLFDGRVRQAGMVLTFDNETDRTMFLLKWG